MGRVTVLTNYIRSNFGDMVPVPGSLKAATELEILRKIVAGHHFFGCVLSRFVYAHEPYFGTTRMKPAHHGRVQE